MKGRETTDIRQKWILIMIKDKVNIGPEFLVVDASSRKYKVIKYDWLEFSRDEWIESWSALMTENGGILEKIGANEYIVDGTKTRVRKI